MDEEMVCQENEFRSARNNAIEPLNAPSREGAWKMEDLTGKIEDFIAVCNSFGASRELAIAITNAEQALMWAMKHVNERRLNK